MMIRRYRDGDLPQVGNVHALSRQAAYAELVPHDSLARVTPEAQTAAWSVRLAAIATPYEMFVAVEGDTVVGFALALAHPGQAAELNAIHVLPEHQGTGIGRALMAAVVATFAAWRVADAHLHVIAGNERGQAFYRRTGWHLHGEAGTHEIAGAVVPVLEYRLDVNGAAGS
ncbi:MAG: putative GCN5-related N-acetyltransferase [Frankiales bacterium]|nr:putative GCN5-related N-acetyltransferase [Frankiales bacterium]